MALLLGLAVLFVVGSVRTSAQEAEDAEGETPAVSEYARLAEVARFRDAITSEFVFVPPFSLKAAGVPRDEAKAASEVLYGASKALLFMQNSKGVIDLYGPIDRKSLGGYVTGTHAFAVWTMIALGEDLKSPAMENAIAILSDLVETGQGASTARRGNIFHKLKGAQRIDTYELGLVLMMYHALAEARQAADDSAKGVTAETPLMPHERTDKQAKKVSAALLKRLTKPELATAKAVTKELADRQAKDGGWTYGSYEHRSDPSNAFFGVLGLYAAFKTGLYTPAKAPLESAAKFWMKHQRTGAPQVSIISREGDYQLKDGSVVAPGSLRDTKASPAGWGYDIHVADADDVRLSMTAAGIASLTMIRHMLLLGAGTAKGNKSVEALDTPIRDGIAYLWQYLGMDPVKAREVQRIAKENADPEAAKKAEEAAGDKAKEDGKDKPGKPKVPPMNEETKAFLKYPNRTGYTMFAIAQAGILTGNNFFGSTEWYPPGVKEIVWRQKHLRTFDPEVAGKAREEAIKSGSANMTDRNLRPIDPEVCFDLMFLKLYQDKSPKVVE